MALSWVGAVTGKSYVGVAPLAYDAAWVIVQVGSIAEKVQCLRFPLSRDAAFVYHPILQE